MTSLDMTFNNEKARTHLASYLSRVRGYSNFDETMKLRVFVDSYGDFAGFEGVDYAIGFLSFNHKISDILNSRVSPFIMTFKAFDEIVSHI